MSSGLPAHVEEADLISYGLIGLINAIERFDLDREIKFETYAITRIKGAIIDELRALDWVPALGARPRARDRARQRQARAQAAAGADRRGDGRASCDISVEEFQESLVQISNSTIAALDELWTVSDASGDQVSLLDTLHDPDAPDPQQLLDATELKDRVADAIARLPEREKLVIALYYYENLTLREIGEVLGVTESRISQLHTKAVLRLRVASAGRQTCATDAARASALVSRGYKPASPGVGLRARGGTGMHQAADRIRNVALVGHRGSGKTSLHEALLFEAGAVNRLGTVTDGTTVSDADDGREGARDVDLRGAGLASSGRTRKVNLIDTPGEPSFVADALGALRVCESAVFVVNARDGRRGLDAAAVGARRRARPRAAGLREHARPRAGRLLPHARLAARPPSARTSSRPRSRSAPSTRSAA